MYEAYLWLGIILLLTVVVLEWWKPKLITEGFASLVSVGDSAFWARWMPRRGDVGPNPTDEQAGYIRDIRYFAGFTDVQRLGQDHDFCRMVQLDGRQDETFFACALGGTEGLSTVTYKTPSTKDGFELSRDDYMNDVLKEGRSGYCRILKTGPTTFEAKCNPAGDSSFQAKLVVDANPPKKIQTMLTFYQGIVFWLRLKDDLLDYAKNLTITTSGNMEIDEVPKDTTEGLVFDGKDQFMKIGESNDLSFGDIVQLRYLRATCFWAYFEEFTNNAKIFDFGNGAGKDNVFVGIMGRGNPGKQQEDKKGVLCLDQAINTVPEAPSGQQCTEEVDPKTALHLSSADVNRWDCPKQELFGRIMPPLQPKKAPEGDALFADLIYEIWDEKQRKLHIQVKNVIPLRKWVHIAITAEGGDPWKPALKIYANGVVVHTEESAWLPQTNYTTSNYIGKSNWANATSAYDNADELFKGKLFDFRGYRTAMTEKKVKDTVAWGQELLGLQKNPVNEGYVEKDKDSDSEEDEDDSA